MSTKTDKAENVQAAYDLLDSLREFNRMSAEDQELITNAKAALVEGGAEPAEEAATPEEG